jgi:hypothetical protein
MPNKWRQTKNFSDYFRPALLGMFKKQTAASF